MKKSTSTPIRWNFTGDRGRAQQLTGYARKLLGGVEAQKKRRDGGFGHRAVTLADGEKISITSLRGIANVTIGVPLAEELEDPCLSEIPTGFKDICICTPATVAITETWIKDSPLYTFYSSEFYELIWILGFTRVSDGLNRALAATHAPDMFTEPPSFEECDWIIYSTYSTDPVPVHIQNIKNTYDAWGYY